MKKRLISLFLLLIICLSPVFLTGCNVGGDNGGGSGDAGDTTGGGGSGGEQDNEEDQDFVDLGDYFEGIHTASTDEENPSAETIVAKFGKIAEYICADLMKEYGSDMIDGEPVAWRIYESDNIQNVFT